MRCVCCWSTQGILIVHGACAHSRKTAQPALAAFHDSRQRQRQEKSERLRRDRVKARETSAILRKVINFE